LRATDGFPDPSLINLVGVFGGTPMNFYKFYICTGSGIRLAKFPGALECSEPFEDQSTRSQKLTRTKLDGFTVNKHFLEFDHSDGRSVCATGVDIVRTDIRPGRI
jgi:hypothetical protein